MRSVKNAGCRYHKNDSCRKIGSLFYAPGRYETFRLLFSYNIKKEFFMYHFYIKERMFTFKNRFQVFLESGKEVYNVEGKLFSFGDELKLTDLDGRTLASVNQKLMSLVPRYEISVSGTTRLPSHQESHVFQTEI